jgi:hypothetical protein
MDIKELYNKETLKHTHTTFHNSTCPTEGYVKWLEGKIVSYSEKINEISEQCKQFDDIAIEDIDGALCVAFISRMKQLSSSS